MRSRTFIITGLLLTVLLAGIGGLYAYDQSGRDRIPAGVRVAGIDVGGLGAAQAKARLERDYLTRLRAPIRVDHGTDTFTLTAQQSQVATNLDAMVDDALAKVHDGNMFTRSYRRLTGGRLHVDLRPQTTYAKGAVVGFLDSIRTAVDRDPIDARATFTADGLSVRNGREGLAVLAHQLHTQIRRAVVDPSADHTLVARTEHIPPKVSTQAIDKQYATALIVDRASYHLKLFKDFKLVKSYPIAIGMVGLETPAGLYHIQSKTVNPAWTKPNSDWIPAAERGQVVPGGTAANPLKARWLGIFDGAGIHGIDPSEYGSIGHAASHGCVRMTIPDVVELYPQVPIGAPIYIA